MIKGIPQKKRLSKKAILELISEGDIFNFYLPNLKLGDTIISPFRTETVPSLYVNERKGEWRFMDLGDSKYRGDCFELVQQLHPGLDFLGALSKIANDFGLPLEGIEVKDYKQIIKSLPKQKSKPPAIIEVIPRAFSRAETQWWNRHLQSLDDLKQEYIFATGKAYLNGKLLPQAEDEMAFAYYFPDLDKWKLYYPQRTQGNGKWLGNIPTSYVEGKENLIGVKHGIIQKSRKDRLVGQKLFGPVCNTQNETRACFNEGFVSFLEENVQNKYVWFDADAPGKKNSLIITQEFGYKHLNTPDQLLPNIKDLGGWVYEQGPRPAIQFLYSKNLI